MVLSQAWLSCHPAPQVGHLGTTPVVHLAVCHSPTHQTGHLSLYFSGPVISPFLCQSVASLTLISFSVAYLGCLICSPSAVEVSFSLLAGCTAPPHALQMLQFGPCSHLQSHPLLLNPRTSLAPRTCAPSSRPCGVTLSSWVISRLPPPTYTSLLATSSLWGAVFDLASVTSCYGWLGRVPCWG